MKAEEKEDPMTMRFDLETDLPKLAKKYHSLPTRKEKTKMLDDWETMTGYSRKYLIQLFSRHSYLDPKGKTQRRSRTPVYPEAVIRVAAQMRQVINHKSCRRMVAMMPDLVRDAPGKIDGFTPEIGEDLLKIGHATLQRRLAAYSGCSSHRKSGKTRAAVRSARRIRNLIPVSTYRPQDCEVGLGEADTVAFFGHSHGGEVIHAVSISDVNTGWISVAPVLACTADNVVFALMRMLDRLPFRAHHIHSDNGSEFINQQLFKACASRAISLTRSREYRSNDNPHIEQKNFTCVRQILGYRRYDTPEQLRQIRRVLEISTLITNLFEPSEKLLVKKRNNAKLHRTFDTPKTPLQRLIEYQRTNRRRRSAKLREFIALRETLNLFDLYAELDKRLNALIALPHSLSKSYQKKERLYA